MPTTQTKTIKTSGGDYSGIIAYEAAEQANLVTGDVIKQFECYAFEDSLGAGASAVFDGWTTDATRYIRGYAATGNQHSCAANTGYRILFEGFGHGIEMREEFMRVEGIGFKSYNTGPSSQYGDRGFHIETPAAGDIRISKAWLNTKTNDDSLVRMFGASTSGIKIWNCMSGPGTSGGGHVNTIKWQTTGNIWLYNNTIVGNAMAAFEFCIEVESGFGGTIVLKNNLCDRGPSPDANASCYQMRTATTTGSTNNLSDDATAPGTSAQTNVSPSYVDETNADLRLVAGSAGLNVGADLSADADIAFADDILGTARPQVSVWDIGAGELLAPTIAVTGTATASITEADVVTGSKTVIATVTNDTFVVATGTPLFNSATTKGTTAADSAGGGGGRTGNGTLTCTFPSGYTPTAGHFALMILYSDQGSGSLPTNWSEVTGSPFGAGTEKLNIFYKVLAGGESDPVTTISGSGTNISHCANMAIYTGVGTIGAIGTPSNGTGTPMTAGAITTTADNSIVCACSGRGDNENSSGQTFNASATGVAERLDGGTAAGNDSQVSMADLTIASSGSSSGAASSTTSITDPWVSVIIELVASTPFADARAAIRNGLDSAQSEAAGWDAKVKGNIPVANVVRTSSTVVTVTLQAQADYDITAQETITWTMPASALTGASAIVGSPTFTVAPAATVSLISIFDSRPRGPHVTNIGY